MLGIGRRPHACVSIVSIHMSIHMSTHKSMHMSAHRWLPSRWPTEPHGRRPSAQTTTCVRAHACAFAHTCTHTCTHTANRQLMNETRVRGLHMSVHMSVHMSAHRLLACLHTFLHTFIHTFLYICLNAAHSGTADSRHQSRRGLCHQAQNRPQVRARMCVRTCVCGRSCMACKHAASEGTVQTSRSLPTANAEGDWVPSPTGSHQL